MRGHSVVLERSRSIFISKNHENQIKVQPYYGLYLCTRAARCAVCAGLARLSAHACVNTTDAAPAPRPRSVLQRRAQALAFTINNIIIIYAIVGTRVQSTTWHKSRRQNVLSVRAPGQRTEFFRVATVWPESRAQMGRRALHAVAFYTQAAEVGTPRLQCRDRLSL